MKTKLNGVINLILTLLLLVITVIGGRGILSASAASTAHTGALEDLQKDESFKASDYADDSEDYAIKVIQIAEGTGGELFLYTYQPCQKTKYLIATDINMSLSESADGTKPYKLTLLSVNGVFGKYLVNGVTVSSDKIRYYNITSIYRAWDKTIDAPTGNDNTVDEVVYPVKNLWTATTSESGIIYDCNETRVVLVTDKYCGYMRFYDGYKLYKTACDSHYIAFSTDYYIENLLEAEVSFVTKDYTCNITSIQNPPEMGGGATNFYDYDYAEPVERQVLVESTQQGGNTGDGLFGVKYLWERIEKVTDFLNDPNNILTETAKAGVSDKQWILRFVDLPYTLTAQFNGSREVGTYVTEETILRLEFETFGEHYNLGVVDNKQTGGSKPSNSGQPQFDFWQWLADIMNVPRWAAQAIFWGAIVLIALAVVLPVLNLFIPVGKVIYYLFFGLWWLISLPFRGIAALIRKIRGEE